MKKPLIFNQENAEPKQYRRYPSGIKKAELVYILKDGECPCKWENEENLYTDGKEVWRRMPFDVNNK